MPKVVVRKDSTSAINMFNRVCQETKRDARKHEFYMRPGMKRMEKSKEATKLKHMLRKKGRAGAAK